LYRLLVFPITIAARVFEVFVIAICVFIADNWATRLTNYGDELGLFRHGSNYSVSVIVHIIISVLILTVFLVVLSILWNITVLLLSNKIFFFLIDIVPSEGRSYAQAVTVVKRGDMARLLLKMEFPETWTDSDTIEYIKRLSPVVRVLYGQRIRNRLPDIIHILEEAKREGVDLSEDTLKIQQRLKPLNDLIGADERLITNWVFRSTLWLVLVLIVCLVMYYR
jgi:hypothetical protein